MVFLEVLWVVVGCLVVFVCSVVAHEYGHVWVLSRIHGRKVGVHFVGWGFKKGWFGFGLRAGKLCDYAFLTGRELVWVYLVGLLAGFFVVVAAGFLSYYYWVVLIVYVGGCERDLKNLFVLLKGSSFRIEKYKY